MNGYEPLPISRLPLWSGMLRVRSRLFDVLALGGVGLLLVTLALNIPNQP